MATNVKIHFDQDNVHISGSIDDNVMNGMIQYVAAAPIERRATYTGSALPFATSAQALDNTPNKGSVELLRNNTFSISIKMPNSYYINLGTNLVPPTLYIMYNEGKKVISIKLADPVPYRTLTYPSSRVNCLFYDGLDKLPVRTQEQILHDSAYPSDLKQHSNFWGSKPMF